MGFCQCNLNYIDLGYANYEKDDPYTIILFRLLAGHSKFEKLKAHKKELNEELMPAVQHSKRPIF